MTRALISPEEFSIQVIVQFFLHPGSNSFYISSPLRLFFQSLYLPRGVVAPEIWLEYRVPVPEGTGDCNSFS